MPEPPLEPALDPRIRRTREQLQCALARLLQTDHFDRISVHEITDAAGVNRATFYAHYTDKFALLECMVATRFHALLDERGIVVAGGCTNALRGLIVGLCDFLTQATCPNATPEPSRPLQPHMETALVAVLRRMILDGMASHDDALPKDHDAVKGTGFSPSIDASEEKGAGSLGLQPRVSPEGNIRAAAIAWAIYGATREALSTPNHPPADQLAAAIVALVAPLVSPIDP